jgi:hypothetical protein
MRADASVPGSRTATLANEAPAAAPRSAMTVATESALSARASASTSSSSLAADSPSGGGPSGGGPAGRLCRRRDTAHRSARSIRYSRSAAANSRWPANIRAMAPSRPPSARSGRTAQACSPAAASPASPGNRRTSSAREVSHTGRLAAVTMPRASGRPAALLAPPLPSRAGCSCTQASSMSRSPDTAQSTPAAAPAAEAASATRSWGSPAPGSARSITRRTRSSDRGGPAGARASAAPASGSPSTSGTASPDSCWHHDDHVTGRAGPDWPPPRPSEPQTKPIVTTRILSVIVAERPDLAAPRPAGPPAARSADPPRRNPGQ